MNAWGDPSNNPLGGTSIAPAGTAMAPEESAGPIHGLLQRARGLAEAIFPSEAGRLAGAKSAGRYAQRPISGLAAPPEPDWPASDYQYAMQNNAPPSEGRIVSGGGEASSWAIADVANARSLGLQGPSGTTEERSAADQAGGGLSYTQNVAMALGLDPRHIRYADGPGGGGLQGARLIPVGGSGARGLVEESSPFEMSMRPRAAAAFDLLSNVDPNIDITGTLAAFRDTNDVASYMNELYAKDAVEKMKASIGRMLLVPPTESQLGALPEYVNNGEGVAVPVYNQHDLLERYRSALRMAVLERQGTIELDHDNWTIKSIGKNRLTPEQFVQEIRDRYQSAFADGVRDADKRLKAGEWPIGEKVPIDLQRGIFADRHAQAELRTYLNSIGVPEGPGQLVALNRWAYYQDGSGLHAQPDVLIDAGIPHRHILDGKATMFEELSLPMRRQLGGYYYLGTNTVGGVTPYGHIPVSRKDAPSWRR